MDDKIILEEIPKDHGPRMRMWLERFGLVNQRPYVRASDFNLATSRDEFAYYLRRRLRLVHPLEYSLAKERGSWYHAWAETYTNPLSTAPETRLNARCQELKEAGVRMGMSGASITDMLTRERHDMQVAQAWWESAIASKRPNLQDFLDSFRTLGTEVECRTIYRLGTSPIILGARMDRLLYNEDDDTIWALDYKSTDMAPSVRLSTVPIEFQSVHYQTLLALLLEEEWFLELYDLRPSTRVGGMIHVAFQKPSIEFSGKDRAYNIVTGPKGGQKKEYYGEPVWANYLARVKDWMNGTGEYLHEAPKLINEPRVNWSVVDAALLLDDNRVKRYIFELEWLGSLANRPAHPSNFRQASFHLTEYGKLSKWAPFYLNHPREWPTIIKHEGFLIGDQDADRPFIGPNLKTVIAQRKRGRGAQVPISGLCDIIGSHREEGE